MGLLHKNKLYCRVGIFCQIKRGVKEQYKVDLPWYNRHIIRIFISYDSVYFTLPSSIKSTERLRPIVLLRETYFVKAKRINFSLKTCF